IPEPQHFYAPTERCPWRGRLVQGEVHDENAWALGGLSSHAGLFGSIDDVSWYGLFLRSQLMGISKTFLKSRTVKVFTNRARSLGKGDWALGFMMPTPGSSSCGDYFRPIRWATRGSLESQFGMTLKPICSSFCSAIGFCWG